MYVYHRLPKSVLWRSHRRRFEQEWTSEMLIKEYQKMQDSGHRVRFSFAARQILQSESGRPPALSLGLCGTWDKVEISGVNSLNFSIIVTWCAPGKPYITWLSPSWKNYDMTTQYTPTCTINKSDITQEILNISKHIERSCRDLYSTSCFYQYQSISISSSVSLSVHLFRLGHLLALAKPPFNCNRWLTIVSQQKRRHWGGQPRAVSNFFDFLRSLHGHVVPMELLWTTSWWFKNWWETYKI